VKADSPKPSEPAKPIDQFIEKALEQARDGVNGIYTRVQPDGLVTVVTFIRSVDLAWVNFTAEQLDELIKNLQDARAAIGKDEP
jgi:hypothetical protein